MIPFILLIIFTFILGMVLFFYPPNIPLKLKMLLLGLAFLLASGGLVVLDNLSYGLAFATIMAIAFVASYVADKRINLIPASAGQAEVVPSFLEKENKSQAFNTNVEGPELKNTVSVEIISEIEEMEGKDVLIESPKKELVSEIQVFESLDVIDLLDMESEDIEVINIETESVEPIQKLSSTETLVELTDEEFAFLTETREISEEDVTDLPIATDIVDVDIFLQRSSLFKELDEEQMLEELPQELVSLDNQVSQNDEEEQALKEVITEASNTAFIEEYDTQEAVGETAEIPVIEEVHLEKELNILEEIPIQEPEYVDITPDEYETIVDEKVAAKDVEEELEVKVTEVVETEGEGLEVEETKVEQAVPEMDAEVQDMLLHTLNTYKHQGDYKSYVVMAETVLNQSLSDKDYYLFGKLLLDSYASLDEYSRIRELLDTMETRLQSYATITEELERYKEIFLVKQ